MPNTYTQLYIQTVFTVTGREHLIPQQHKAQVYKYITGIVQNRNNKLIAINGMPDHVHLFVGLHPTQSISALMEDVKSASSKFIKRQPWMRYNFSWQKGYGAFSYSRSHIDAVVKYIANQERHHQTRTFREEYLDLLQKFDVAYDERYLFDFLD